MILCMFFHEQGFVAVTVLYVYQNSMKDTVSGKSILDDSQMS